MCSYTKMRATAHFTFRVLSAVLLVKYAAGSFHKVSIYVYTMLIFSARTICTDGDVRLEDKESEYVGRVGLCYKGVWGSVFDFKINDSAAIVVCRQLGLPNHGK